MERNNENVAIYVRVSKENIKSLENQSKYLKLYALKNNWKIYKVYQDNGYSGGNFIRPGFLNMLEDLKSNKINIILCKDLSRLGRNYQEINKYLNDYFPLYKIRFIALNDNYDSLNNVNEYHNIKNIINEFYLLSIKSKIRASIKHSMKEGKFKLSKIPLYGYKHENNKRIIDIDKAKIVQKIFDMFINNYNINDILSYLTINKVAKPLINEQNNYKWSYISILSILKNEEYLGHYIRDKKNNSYIFYNVFSPIISLNTFNKAKSILKHQKVLKDYLQRDIIFCFRCKRPMLKIKKKDKKYYYCYFDHNKINENYLRKKMNQKISILHARFNNKKISINYNSMFRLNTLNMYLSILNNKQDDFSSSFYNDLENEYLKEKEYLLYEKEENMVKTLEEYFSTLKFISFKTYAFLCNYIYVDKNKIFVNYHHFKEGI